MCTGFHFLTYVYGCRMRYNRCVVNLLPIKDARRVTGEHRRRVAIVFMLLLMCSAVVALLFIIPSFIVVWSGASGFDDQLEATKTLVDLQRKQGGGSEVIELSERSVLLEEALSRRSATSILQDIAPRVPEGVSVRQFSYSLGEGDISVSVLGTAATRAALIAFGDALRQSSLFSRVDVPVSSLAKNEDIEFTLTLLLDEPVALESYRTDAPTPVVEETLP